MNSLRRTGTEEQEKYKAVAARDKAKADRMRTEVEKRGAASERPRTAWGAKACSAWLCARYILKFTELKVTILVPDKPKL